ncbi:sce7726 family protein [Paraburkholderia sp.]|uniref:sce7726 family protein n=1 Tax=Paraburkholderia sp. TaxID=1926495 RepID=UPI00238FCDD2|nr:sce7726 family protein [Paraburkholderia sp.]MDE1182146.1 sce7726 family protein [Paraburkholderia sp.]
MAVTTPTKTPSSRKPALTRDRDVRAAVRRKVLADHIADPAVLVLDELGLEHGACRVDIAVINGSIHGYELKSDADTLARLPQQIEIYSRALDRATLVVGERHLDAAKRLLPDWWGIKVTSTGVRGAVYVESERSAVSNPGVSPFHVAHLLWRNEAVEILAAMDVTKKDLRGSRAELYALLARLLPLAELRSQVRSTLKQRSNWRRHSLPL